MKKIKTFIIAEAGVNHNGHLALARRLIDAAKDCGADAVKFQTFCAERLATAKAAKATYQKKTGRDRETQKTMLARLELDERDHRQLIAHCRKRKILFMSSPFDEKSADLLFDLGVRIFKIASGEITNLPFLKHVARKRKPIILSTGMSTLDEVRQAVRAIYSSGNKQLTLLHCVTDYPAPVDQVNLRVIEMMQKEFHLPVGFSDHTAGIVAAPIAVALGAKVVEKHLTMGRSLPGPDHKASLVPKEFREMVQRIREVEQMLGDGVKRPSVCEKKYISLVRKSVVAAKMIAPGQQIQATDLLIKRPATGIPPQDLLRVIGRRAETRILADQPVQWRHLR